MKLTSQTVQLKGFVSKMFVFSETKIPSNKFEQNENAVSINVEKIIKHT